MRWSMPKSPEKLLYSIQALRFFAAVGVVIHHSLTSLGAQMTTVLVGAAGVDVFFVISGVVIGSMDSRDGVLTFAIKRLIRASGAKPRASRCSRTKALVDILS